MTTTQMFSAVALKADSLTGCEAQSSLLIPAGGSILEHSTPARGYHVFADLSWLLSFSEDSHQENIIFLHVELKLQALQSSGKNMLCVSESLDARKISVGIKITQWLFLVYYSLEQFGPQPDQDSYGCFAGFHLLSLSSGEPRQAHL